MLQLLPAEGDEGNNDVTSCCVALVSTDGREWSVVQHVSVSNRETTAP
jgi:hypothetical protein